MLSEVGILSIRLSRNDLHSLAWWPHVVLSSSAFELLKIISALYIGYCNSVNLS